MTCPRLIVFSDLDGTLLDHETYQFDAAQPALDLLKQHGIPLILNSSKTRAEITAIRDQLQNTAPFIIENGAAVIIPPGWFGHHTEKHVLFSRPLEEIRHWLDAVRTKHHYAFTGFQDMTISELMQHTGLTRANAEFATQRIGTEPLLWQDSDTALARFQQQVENAGLQWIQGGRFLHIMGRFDKADAMHYLITQFRQHHPDQDVVSIALGDSPNDTRMLQLADYAVVIKGANSAAVHLNKSPGREMRSREPGPQGWNQCLSELIPALLNPTVNT